MSRASQVVEKVSAHPYVVSRRDICQGSPVIRGSRLRVIDVAIEYDRLGYTPDQILDAHPHINLAEVHDALSYYYENQKKLDEHLKKNLSKVSQIRKRYPSKVNH